MHKFKCLVIVGLIFGNVWCAEPAYTYNWDKCKLLRKHSCFDELLNPVVWTDRMCVNLNMPYLYSDMIFGFKRLETENAELKNKLTAIEAKLDQLLAIFNNAQPPAYRE